MLHFLGADEMKLGALLGAFVEGLSNPSTILPYPSSFNVSIELALDTPRTSVVVRVEQDELALPNSFRRLWERTGTSVSVAEFWARDLFCFRSSLIAVLRDILVSELFAVLDMGSRCGRGARESGGTG